METHDTIAAISTGLKTAALGLIRVSGPKAKEIVESSFAESKSQLEDRRPSLRTLVDIEGEVMDQVVACFFKAPRSFTGEDLVELSCHGNPQILKRILRDFVSRGTRLAEAGEFSRRALAHGKMNLAQLEALDLTLNSESIMGAKLGVKALESRFQLPLFEFRQAILDLMVDIQSSLDFPEEEVGPIDEESLSERISSLIERLKAWIRAFQKFRPYLGSRRFVFLGPPNSGKSSLFNALIGFERALVFDQPGTTRDSLDYRLETESSPVYLVDTAGLRTEPEQIEALGIERSIQEARQADRILWVSSKAELPPPELLKLKPAENWVFVHSKSDLEGESAPSPWVPVSIFKPEQLKSLEDLLFGSDVQSSELPVISSERQFSHLQKAQSQLIEAQRRLKAKEALEWVAQPMLDSANEIGEILGEIQHEELLRSILSKFCIGK